MACPEERERVCVSVCMYCTSYEVCDCLWVGGKVGVKVRYVRLQSRRVGRSTRGRKEVEGESLVMRELAPVTYHPEELRREKIEKREHRMKKKTCGV